MKYVLLAAFALCAAEASAQIPETFTNLTVLPQDIARGELIERMRGFSFALGARCETCHYDPVGDGSFRDIDFASDENPMKDKARFMIRMLDQLNGSILPAMADRGDPPVTMTCKTCHRGQRRPLLLGQDLLLTVHESGADSAATRYRFLRDRFGMSGAFDFGENETNRVAEQLAREDRVADAIVILTLNAEFHPDSPLIQAGLGELHAAQGDTLMAISAYERAIELGAPERQIRPRLDALLKR